MGEKSADNIIESINNSKNCSMHEFINGLGIRHIGENTSKLLEHYFSGDIIKFMNTLKDELISINEIGEVMANSIIEYFSDENNKKLINQCIDGGLIFKEVNEIKSSQISGKIFVFTGTLHQISRSEAINLIERYGAKSSSSISKKTDFVVAGENAGSKLEKAKEKNITILNEATFLDFLNSN